MHRSASVKSLRRRDPSGRQPAKKGPPTLLLCRWAPLFGKRGSCLAFVAPLPCLVCCFPALVLGLGASSAGCLRCGRRGSTWWLGVTLGLRRSGLLALPAGSYNGWLTTAFLPSRCGRLIFV